jgi:hypothetical protein
MIPIEKLKQVTIVYTHAHCPDGLASAMILKDAFRMLGMAPRIEFLAHGTVEHAQAGIADDAFSLFCDFAPTPDVTQLMKGTGRMIVLDHHVGAKGLVESFGENGVYADAEKEPGVSGAVLAFREVWLSTFAEMVNLNENVADSPQHDRVRDFALCIGARDTWQTKDERFVRGQWISKMLMSKPASHWLEPQGSSRSASGVDTPLWSEPYLTEQEVEMGRALFEAHQESVRQAVDQCVSCSVRAGDNHGYIALLVFQEQASGFRLCSDVAEALRTRAKTLGGGEVPAVVAGFAYVVDKPGDKPRLLYSLRGLGGFDVCAFAKANGGGGHKAAAGFSADPASVTDPYALVRDRLGMFLVADQ